MLSRSFRGRGGQGGRGQGRGGQGGRGMVATNPALARLATVSVQVVVTKSRM
jgi:hypothetical protein